MYDVDPVGIAHERDEYRPEAERILVSARDVNDVDGLAKIVTAVFDEMFWPGACSKDNASEIARRVSSVVHRLHGSSPHQ